MTDKPQKPQNAQKAAEQERLAKALRDNLYKRKQQQRSRHMVDGQTALGESTDTEESPKSAG